MSPSQKQLAFAEELARQAGWPVPEGARRSAQECKQLIEQLLAVKPPSEGQLAFAQELARQAHTTVPEGARRSGQMCRQFIDELKVTVVLPPSENQLRFAEDLARMAQRPVPEGARRSAQECGHFIDELKAVQMPLPHAVAPDSVLGQWGGARPSAHGDGPPTQKQLAFAEDLARQAQRPVPEGARWSFQECKQFIDEQVRAALPPTQNAHGDGPPTQKQLAFAEDLARQARRMVPEGARWSFQECQQFIEQLKAELPPSQKGLAFAEELARQAGWTVPDAARRSALECSRVIEQLKAVKPPSENQLRLAEDLAWKAQRPVPDGARRSAQECGQFIEELNAARVPLPHAVAPDSVLGQWGDTRPSAHGDGPPTQKQLAFAEELARQARRMVPEGARRSFQECNQFIDQLKPMMPPSEKQLWLAEELAREAQRPVPEGARRSSQQCSQFIDELKAAQVTLPHAVAPDSVLGQWGGARPSAHSDGFINHMTGEPSWQGQPLAAPGPAADVRPRWTSDARSGLHPGGDEAPSQTFLAFAEWLARDAGLRVPDDVRRSKRLLEGFVDELNKWSGLTEAQPATGPPATEPLEQASRSQPATEPPPAPSPWATGPFEPTAAAGSPAAEGLVLEPAAAEPPPRLPAEDALAAEREEDGGWASLERADEVVRGVGSEMRQLQWRSVVDDEASENDDGPDDEAGLAGGAADVGPPEDEAAARGAPEQGSEAFGGGEGGGGCDLGDKKVAFTGKLIEMGITRSEASAAAQAAGATVVDSKSASLDILVAGVLPSGSKLVKAQELGKEVWDEAKFMRAAGL